MTTHTTVRLCWAELQQAAAVGCQRQLRALARRAHEAHGAHEAGDWQRHIAGAAAEMAVAKLLDRYWADSRPLDYSGDVGSVHVRSTDRLDGCLILHDADPDDGCFVLVVGSAPLLHVVGWAYARDVKLPRYWDDGQRLRDGGGYLVPQSALRPLDELARS